jgi:hypothetical protein
LFWIWLQSPLLLAQEGGDEEAPPEQDSEEAAEQQTALQEAAESQALELAELRVALEAAQFATSQALEAAGDAQARVSALEDAEAAAEESVSVDFAAGKGLQLTSPNGAFSLTTQVRGQFKARLEENGDGDAALALEIRRARLSFSGNVGSEDVGYRVQLGFSPSDVGTSNGVLTTSPIVDLYFDFKYLDGANIRVGQFVVPFGREQLTSDGRLNLVDRSLAHNEFTLSRDVGLMVSSKAPGGRDKIRYAASITSGEGRNVAGPVDLGLLYATRVEFLPLGNFSDLDIPALDHPESPQVALGLAVAWLDQAKKDEGIGGNVPADGGTTDTWNVTGDGIVKYRGFSGLGALHWRRGVRDPSNETVEGEDFVIDEPRNGWGWLMQVGWLLPAAPTFDVVARFAQTRGLGETSLDNRNELTFGIGWYINGSHTLKINGDVAHAWGTDGIPHGKTHLWFQMQVMY